MKSLQVLCVLSVCIVCAIAAPRVVEVNGEEYDSKSTHESAEKSNTVSDALVGAHPAQGPALESRIHLGQPALVHSYGNDDEKAASYGSDVSERHSLSESHELKAAHLHDEHSQHGAHEEGSAIPLSAGPQLQHGAHDHSQPPHEHSDKHLEHEDNSEYAGSHSTESHEVKAAHLHDEHSQHGAHEEGSAIPLSAGPQLQHGLHDHSEPPHEHSDKHLEHEDNSEYAGSHSEHGSEHIAHSVHKGPAIPAHDPYKPPHNPIKNGWDIVDPLPGFPPHSFGFPDSFAALHSHSLSGHDLSAHPLPPFGFPPISTLPNPHIAGFHSALPIGVIGSPRVLDGFVHHPISQYGPLAAVSPYPFGVAVAPTAIVH